MVTRTIQFLGQGYGNSPASVTVTANGNSVFSGTVDTIDAPVPDMPNFDLQSEMKVLFTMDVDSAFSGEIPMTCQVTNSTILFAQVFANYSEIPNPAMTAAQYSYITNNKAERKGLYIYEAIASPPFSPAEITILENPATPDEEFYAIIDSHGASANVSSGATGFAKFTNTDVRNTVTINGIPQTPDHSGLEGTWWWSINNGSTLAYNLEVTTAKL